MQERATEVQLILAFKSIHYEIHENHYHFYSLFFGWVYSKWFLLHLPLFSTRNAIVTFAMTVTTVSVLYLIVFRRLK